MKKSLSEYLTFESFSAEEGRVTAHWTVNGEIPFFEGHFPDSPVLPAICIIDISLLLLKKKFPKINLREINIKKSKFMDMVTPNQKVIITATLETEELWRVLWQTEDQQNLAQITLVI